MLLAGLAVAVLALSPGAALGLTLFVLATRGAVSGARLLARRRERTTITALGPASEHLDATIIGHDDNGAPVVVHDSDLRSHGLILGASGSGKTTTMLQLLTARIERGGPVVAIDLKGSPAFTEALKQAAEAAGRPFSVWSPDGPSHWNPLACGNATELKDKLIATERFTEPHYQRAAERYVQQVLQVLDTINPGQQPSLQQVVELLEPRRLAIAARELPQARADRLREYITGLTPDQTSAVRGLASRLAIMTESHVGEYLQPADDAIDLRAAVADNQVVVFSLNSSTYGRLAAQLGTLAVQDLITATGARQSATSAAEDPELAIVAIDEFSALDSANVISLLARGREAGVGVVLATQELADLERAGRGFSAQVLGNTNVKIAHRQDVPSSAETVSRLGGTVPTWEQSYTVEPGPLGQQVARSNLRLGDRFRVAAERVRSLRTGEAVVMVKSRSADAHVTRIAARPAERPLER